MSKLINEENDAQFYSATYTAMESGKHLINGVKIDLVEGARVEFPRAYESAYEQRAKVKELEAERDQLKSFCQEFVYYEDNPHEHKLMSEKLDQLKKDLLKLLPIARENTHTSLSKCELTMLSVDQVKDVLTRYNNDLDLINELTAKYTENIKPELKRIDCDGVGDNDGFFELKVGE